MKIINLQTNIFDELLDLNTYIIKLKIRINDCRRDINPKLNLIKETESHMLRCCDDVYFMSFAKDLLKTTMAETRELKTKIACLLKTLKLFESELVKRQKNPHYTIKYTKLIESYHYNLIANHKFKD